MIPAPLQMSDDCSAPTPSPLHPQPPQPPPPPYSDQHPYVNEPPPYTNQPGPKTTTLFLRTQPDVRNMCVHCPECSCSKCSCSCPDCKCCALMRKICQDCGNYLRRVGDLGLVLAELVVAISLVPVGFIIGGPAFCWNSCAYYHSGSSRLSFDSMISCYNENVWCGFMPCIGCPLGSILGAAYLPCMVLNGDDDHVCEHFRKTMWWPCTCLKNYYDTA